MKRVLKIISVSNPRIESSPEVDVKPYLVRDIRCKDAGRFAVNDFFGTVFDDDAMVDIHEGDLVLAKMYFHVHGPKDDPVQCTSFSNIIKLKEID